MRKYQIIVFVLILIGSPLNSMAQDESTSWLSLRSNVLSGVTMWFNESGATIYGAGLELSYKHKNRLVYEGFAHWLVGLETLGYSIGARLGYNLSTSGKWLVFDRHLVPLIGYSYTTHPLGDDGSPMFNLTHNFQFGGAADLFLRTQFGFSARMLCLFEYALLSNKSERGPWSHYRRDLFRYGLHLGVLVGITWH